MPLDARQMMPLAQAMVDQLIPMAEAAEIDGNFTIELKVKRKNGKALVDVQLRTSAR